MKLPTFILAALVLPFLSACGTTNTTSTTNTNNNTSAATPAPATPEAPWVGEARGVAASVPPKLLAVLTSAIEKSGPAGAMDACKEDAPKMARAASEKTGWQIKRVSLKNRNAKAAPDDWERQTLEFFDKSQAAGADVQKLERFEVVIENGQQVRRYMKALPTQVFCLQCHGTPEQLGSGVGKQLHQLYPHDKATGYTAGQIRGAMALRQAVIAPTVRTN